MCDAAVCSREYFPLSDYLKNEPKNSLWVLSKVKVIIQMVINQISNLSYHSHKKQQSETSETKKNGFNNISKRYQLTFFSVT